MDEYFPQYMYRGFANVFRYRIIFLLISYVYGMFPMYLNALANRLLIHIGENSHPFLSMLLMTDLYVVTYI